MHKKIEPKPLTLKSIIDYSVRNFAKMPSVSFVEGNQLAATFQSQFLDFNSKEKIRTGSFKNIKTDECLFSARLSP